LSVPRARQPPIAANALAAPGGVLLVAGASDRAPHGRRRVGARRVKASFAATKA
jgi:hypothetical protein